MVILALFAGGGVLVYLAAWLLIPEEGQPESTAQRWIGSASNQTTLIVVIAVVVGLSIVVPSGHLFGFGPHLGPPGFLLILAAVGLVVWLIRRDDASPSAAPQPITSDAPQPVSYSTPPNDGASMTTAVLPPASIDSPAVPPAVVPPKPREPRSVLGLLTVSATALVAGALVIVNLATDGSNIDATTIFASMLATVALGLLIGTIYGRSRGLIFLGVLLAVVTAVSSALPDVNLSGGVGDRTWRPASASDLDKPFELAIGDGTLDLRNLTVPAAGLTAPISASVGVGQLTVLLPDDLDVQLTADVGAGQIDVQNNQIHGSDRTMTTFIDVPDQTGVINLDLETGLGQIVVKRAPNINVPLKPGANS